MYNIAENRIETIMSKHGANIRRFASCTAHKYNGISGHPESDPRDVEQDVWVRLLEELLVKKGAELSDVELVRLCEWRAKDKLRAQARRWNRTQFLVNAEEDEHEIADWDSEKAQDHAELGHIGSKVSAMVAAGATRSGLAKAFGVSCSRSRRLIEFYRVESRSRISITP